MRRYMLAIFFIFLAITPAYGKEYKSSFGFTMDLPPHWLVLTKQEIKDNPDLFDIVQEELDGIDKNLLKTLSNIIKSGRVEFFFNQKTSDMSFSDNINVVKHVGKIPVNDRQLLEMCDSFPEQLSSAFGRKIECYQCKLKEINGLTFLFLEFEGVLEETRSLQYQIQKSPGVLIIITVTCKNSVLDTIREEFERIISSIRM